jgi:hypothetical protein
MLDSIWAEGNGSNRPLPAPNVVVTRAGARLEELPPEAVKGILVNPIYAVIVAGLVSVLAAKGKREGAP